MEIWRRVHGSGHEMVAAFIRQYPLIQIAGLIALCIAAAWAIGKLAPGDDPLPTPTVMAFLASLILIWVPKLLELRKETIQDSASAYWRFRCATLVGYFLFVLVCLVTGTSLPSAQAQTNLVAAALIAALSAVFFLKPKPGTVGEHPPPDPSAWARFDRMLSHLSAPALIGMALLAALAEGGRMEMTYVFLLVVLMVFSPGIPVRLSGAEKLSGAAGGVLAYVGLWLA